MPSQLSSSIALRSLSLALGRYDSRSFRRLNLTHVLQVTSYSVVNEQWQRRTCRVATDLAAEIFVELIGIEPTTSGLQSQRSPN